MTEEHIRELIAQGTIIVGMTKANIRNLLGPPDGWGGMSRKYREPSIWLYGKIEFWFLTKKYRTPYPGPTLHGIYVEDDNHSNGTMLLKQLVPERCYWDVHTDG